MFVLPGAVQNCPDYFRISLTASDEMLERALALFCGDAKPPAVTRGPDGPEAVGSFRLRSGATPNGGADQGPPPAPAATSASVG